MSFGRFGAKPRSMNNPVYWVNRYREQERINSASVATSNKCKERLERLRKIHRHILENFILVLEGQTLSKSTYDKVIIIATETDIIHSTLEKGGEIPSYAQLSKYATSLKRLSLASMKACNECELYSDLDNVRYDTGIKSILIDNVEFYYFG